MARVRRHHRRDGRAGRPAAAIALVDDAGPGDRFAEAVFAHLAVAEEQGVGAEEAEVVQRLDDRDVLRPRGVVGGRRDQGERVVEVNHVRPVGADRLADFVVAGTAPDRAQPHLQAIHRIDRVVVETVPNHLVAVVLEHGDLGGDAMVLAAGLLVIVVSDQDLHRTAFPFCWAGIASRVPSRQISPFVSEGASSTNPPMKRKTSSSRCHWSVRSSSHECPQRWKTPPLSMAWPSEERANAVQSDGQPRAT